MSNNKKTIRERIEVALDVRRITEMPRAMQGIDAAEITCCLGSPRCLLPSNNDGAPLTCAFCLRYPSGRGSDDLADTVAAIGVHGH